MREGRGGRARRRPVDEYRAGHIPGALSVPVGRARRDRLRELPRRKESSRTAAARTACTPTMQSRAPAAGAAHAAWRWASRSGARPDSRSKRSAQERATRRRASASARTWRPVHAARRRQRLRRRDGRPRARASSPRSRSRSSTSPRRSRDAVVHRRVRRRQGAHQLPRRPTLRPRSDASGCSSPAGSSPCPVPFLLMWAPTLGVGGRRQRAARRQPGPHLVDDGDHEDRPRGPERRGLAMGLNEFAGYCAVAVVRARDRLHRGALRPAAGAVLSRRRLRRRVGLALSVAARARDHGARAARSRAAHARAGAPSQREVFARTSFRDRDLSAVSQAGLVNNLNDGMAWGLFPLFFAAAGHEPRADRLAGGHLPRASGASASSSPARSPTASAASG